MFTFMRRNHQQASVLILVVLTLSLMVTIAVGFMSIVSNQKGNAVAVALQTHAEIAMHEAQATVIRLLNEGAKEITESDGKKVTYTTAKNLPVRRYFYPLVDEDADPMTDNDRRVTGPDKTGTLRPTTGSTRSAHPLINSRIPLSDMRHTGSSSTPNYYRWHTTAWMDSDLQRIDIDDSMSPTERTKRMKSARYVVRYTAQTSDTSGTMSMHNNYPNSIASTGASINRGNGSEDSVHYIRQQNYLRNFGRSIKSMVGSGFPKEARQARMQIRADANLTRQDPLDLETVGLTDENGRRTAAAGPSNAGSRNVIERYFRGGDLQFSGLGMPNYNGKGRQFTWLPAVNMVPKYIGYPFSPYADSLRDADLVDGASGELVGPVSTPWRVNLLSASTGHVLNIMLIGLMSEADLESSQYHCLNADLFGVAYPEPFPLEYDAGRFHDYVGFFNRGDSGILPGGSNGRSSRHSYVNDALFALGWAIKIARETWTEKKGQNSNWVSTGTYIDPTATNNNNDAMINQIIRETYRIVGEHDVNTSAGTVRTGSFMAGDEVNIGDGWRRNGLTKKHPGDNTRAMEYFLNDLMISVFGKANPNFTVGDNVTNESIALDFNQDGYAESTVTGWYDHNNSQRVWSWWWDGLGPYVKLKNPDQNDYMKRAGWYRFVEGSTTPYRRTNVTASSPAGIGWEAVPDIPTFYEYNDIWLKERGSYPIKPFSKTGRMYIGKSRYFCAYIRAEVYDVVKAKPVAAVNRKVWYILDPNQDGDLSDNYVPLQGEMVIE